MDEWKPEPGVYYDIPAEQYHSCPYESNSHLGPMIRRSPLHYLEQERKESKVFDFGRLAHSMVLEPQTLLDYYAVLPDFAKQVQDEAAADGAKPYKVPRGTKRYKELCDGFTTEHEGKQIISPDDLETAKAMRARAVENSLAKDWLEASGSVEVSIVWDDPETGIRCKGRLDKWMPNRNLIIDYKTTDWPPDFSRAIYQYGYHVQAAFYCDGLRLAADLAMTPAFGIIAQEKNPPYTCLAARVHPDDIALGRQQYRTALQRVAECSESGVWPGPENPEWWRLPPWAMPKSEVSFEGI